MPVIRATFDLSQGSSIKRYNKKVCHFSEIVFNKYFSFTVFDGCTAEGTVDIG